jgi:sugar (pentulose or hexulose) kinase
MITEAGTLGAAIIAGVGAGIFKDYAQGVTSMVKLERTFNPDISLHQHYQVRYQQYQRLCTLMADYLRELSAEGHH